MVYSIIYSIIILPFFHIFVIKSSFWTAHERNQVKTYNKIHIFDPKNNVVPQKNKIIRSITRFLWLSITFWLLSLTASRCQKVGETQTNWNRVIQGEVGSKGAGPFFVFYAGHDGTNCPGCIMMSGKLYHVDCQGVGTACAVSTRVSIDQVGSTITATTTDTFGLTNLDFFNMPARSLNYTDESNNRIYLNIPAQLVYRDEETQQFTFTGLSFSDGPMYTNE